MPVPASLASLSTTPASNQPSGGENPFPDLDDHIRAGYAFDAQNRDAIATKLNASAVSAFGLTLIDDADAATARATLGAVGLTGDQAVAGVKTFSSSPIAPTPTAGDNTTKVATTAFVKTAADAAVADRFRFFDTVAQATTSGTVVEYTTIPSWARRVTVLLRNVSTAGTSHYVIQLGSGSFATSGYTDAVTGITYGTNGGADAVGQGIPIHHSQAAQAVTGIVHFVLDEGNTWIAAGSLSAVGGTNPLGITSAGSIALAGVLDRIRITSVSADTFDSGSISYLFEG